MKDVSTGLLDGVLFWACLFVFVQACRHKPVRHRVALKTAAGVLAGAALWLATLDAVEADWEPLHWLSFSSVALLSVALEWGFRRRPHVHVVPPPDEAPLDKRPSSQHASDEPPPGASRVPLNSACLRDDEGPESELLTVTTFGWLPPASSPLHSVRPSAYRPCVTATLDAAKESTQLAPEPAPELVPTSLPTPSPPDSAQAAPPPAPRGVSHLRAKATR